MRKWAMSPKEAVESTASILGYTAARVRELAVQHTMSQSRAWLKSQDDTGLYEGEGYLFNNLHSWLHGISRYCAIVTCKELDAWGYEPTTIVDYGGGPGYSAVLLARHFPLSTVLFWETSESQRQFCHELLKYWNVHNVRVTNHPPVGEVMNCIGVLEHVKYPEPLLRDVMSSYVEVLSIVVGGAEKWAGHFSEYYLSDGSVLKHRDIWQWAVDEAGKRGLFPIEERAYHFNKVPRLFTRPGRMGVRK